MRSLRVFSFFVTALFVLGSCNNDSKKVYNTLDIELLELLESTSQTNSTSWYTLPASDNYIEIPQDIDNPITAEKVALGKQLFFDPAIATQTIKEEHMQEFSCATCHQPKSGFNAGVRQGIAEGGIGNGLRGEGRIRNVLYDDIELDVQTIRSPTAINVAYHNLGLWNGKLGGKGDNASFAPFPDDSPNRFGFEGIETQALAAQTVHRMKVTEEVLDLEGGTYRKMFDAAFPDSPVDERYTPINTALAIAAYERTILANQAPFQKWLKGDKSAMTNNQKEGAMLFFGKARCYLCHEGPALNNIEFYAVGMGDFVSGADVVLVDQDFVEKKGRASFTNREADLYKFKTPTIYNLKEVEFLGHGGTMSTVKEVVEYFNTGKPERTDFDLKYLDKQFYPLNLTEGEVLKITDFIENGLYDADMSRYVPDEVVSKMCFPNCDPQSEEDLGWPF